MKKWALIFLLLTTQCFAATIQWDHDCANTTGFYVYLSDDEIDNPQRQVSIDCPAVQAVVYMPGWYSVTAYNVNGQSIQSNRIEISSILLQFHKDFLQCIRTG